MAIAHGGQVLLSAAAAEAAQAGPLPPGAGLRPLGPHRLKDLLLPETMFQLDLPGLPAEFPPLRSLELTPNNLPIQATAFLGREAELAQLREMLAGSRLVTLLGAGGIGKTRLSLQAGAELVQKFADGVWFVELAGITANEQVAEALAGVLGIELRAGSAAGQAAGALRANEMLIILDNCEHVLEGAAALAAEFLRRCARITLLASSRAPLGIAGEQHFVLPTLGLPASPRNLTAAAAAGHTAIQLFADRARLVAPDFSLDDANAPDIAAICAALDGIPLAIELAAARSKMLRPDELLHRLNDRFSLLKTSSRAAMPRQQTLLALIQWSFDLLSPAERAALARLGVFAGSFDLAAAEAVLAEPPIWPGEVLDLVASLLDKSLIVRLPRDHAATRYRLLESTRHFALDRLAEAGEAQAAYRRHAAHMLRFFTAARELWATTDAIHWAENVEPEIENFTAALAWAAAPDGDDTLCIGLSATVWTVAERGLLARRDRDLAIAWGIARLGPAAPALEGGWIWLAKAEFSNLSASGRIAPARHALDLFEQTGQVRLIAKAAALGAVMLAKCGRVSEAAAVIERCEAVLPRLPRDQLRAAVLDWTSAATSILRHPSLNARTEAYLRECTELARQYRNQRLVFRSLGAYVEAEAIRGNLSAAIASANELLASIRTQRAPWELTWILCNLVTYNVLAGAPDQARHHARELLPLHLDGEDEDSTAYCAAALALVAADDGRFELAARLVGYARDYIAAHELATEPLERAVMDRLDAALGAAAASGALPAQVCQRLMAEGAALGMQAATQLAMTI